MKRDEPFDPSVKSSSAPEGLTFRVAKEKDREAIATLMAIRNPNRALSFVVRETDREIALSGSDSDYRLFVAELGGDVVGFCRFYHSAGLPPSKKKFPSPEGWYAMGIMVHPEFRRRGIAKFLSDHRLEHLLKIGAREVFSLVDAANLTSLRMHEKFNYEKAADGEGFLHIKFESGHGFLMRRAIARNSEL